MNKRIFAFCIFIAAGFGSCKEKKKEPATDKNFISVRSLIDAQVAHVDTSLYSIVMTVSYDTLHTDTTYIPREQFRNIAVDFLNIPDLADPEISEKYKAETARFDELMNRVIITYLPINPEKEEIKKQELLVTPGGGTGDKVSSIIINREINNRDSLLRKDLLWQMDKSFQVVTTSQKPGQPEKIIITRVTWNEDDY